MPVTKEQLKLLVDTDVKMGWWCAVLLGEICEAVTYNKNTRSGNLESVYQIIESRVEELDQIIIQRALEKAKEQLTNDVPIS